MKKYQITFTYTQTSRASAIIKAKNEEEAREKAEEMTSDELEDFNPIDGNLYVEGVEAV